MEGGQYSAHHAVHILKICIGSLVPLFCLSIKNFINAKKTKEIVLAHISAQANTYEQALNVTVNHLLETKKDELNENLRIVAAQQFEIISGGLDYEKVDDCSSLFASDLEWIFNN